MQSDSPFVSVIVPVHNDPYGLRATVGSLLDQTYPSTKYEIVIVDNDSTDRTLDVARSIVDANPETVRCERETDVQSSYAARNTGIEASSGELLAFIDADVVADPDWIETAVSSMRDRDAEYAGCHVDLECSEPTLAGQYNTLAGFPVEHYVREYDFAPTCALFVARTVGDDVGWFDPGFISGGDTEFGHRVAASGRTLHYLPGARVVHPARTSLRSLLGKHVRTGRGIAQRERRYPERYDGRSYLLGILPNHPLRFPTQFGPDEQHHSMPKWIGFYIISYLVRLSKTFGQALERGKSIKRH